MQDNPINQTHRKDQHIGLANQQYQAQPHPDLAQTRLIHQSLPECAVADVDISSSFAGLDFQTPFFINAMTGGSPATTKINQGLAILARETGLAMATGSISIAMKDSAAAASFKIIRQENPEGLVFANLGAHHGLENAKRAVSLLEADALQIHVNAPQEIVMPEGDRSFKGWLDNIHTIVQGLDVPVIVKEVGFGMSRETIQQLCDMGVTIVDISGTGGTNFVRIENARRRPANYDFLTDWGQSAVISLLEAKSLPHPPHLIASGGFHTALDVVKGLALGAKAIGLSAHFLQLVRRPDSLTDAIEAVEVMKNQVADIMSLLGCSSVPDLTDTPFILPPQVAHWCEARDIDWRAYANRK